MKIEIFSKANCPNCVAAKKLLESKGLGYAELDFDDESVRNVFTRLYPDARQMPQIFIDNQRVGGLAGLQAALDLIV